MKEKTAPPNGHRNMVVYRNERYILGQDDRPYLMANGKQYFLTCHPYEPCLYIAGDSVTTVHNAFDPVVVLECFREGKTVTSITGFVYGAEEFCRMVEYAADMGNINIDDAEKIFGDRLKKEPEKERKREKVPRENRHGEDRIIEDERVSAILAQKPDLVTEYVIVENTEKGCDAHRYALAAACRKLFVDGGETIWRYDCGTAAGKQITVDDLFAAANEKRGVNYRGAFMYPPHGGWFSERDFDRVNAVLFPNGKDDLEVCEWTTDWSEFFDDGHEWWGALCYTVYDKTLDRFVVIMASATD